MGTAHGEQVTSPDPETPGRRGRSRWSGGFPGRPPIRHLLPRQQPAPAAQARVDVAVFVALYVVGFGSAVVFGVADFLEFLSVPSDALLDTYWGLSSVMPWFPDSEVLWEVGYQTSGPVAALLGVGWLAHRGVPPAEVGLARPRPAVPRSHSGGLVLTGVAYLGVLHLQSW